MIETYSAKSISIPGKNPMARLFTLLRQLLGFFWGSLSGVIIDLVVFQSLVYMGARPFAANIASSTLAIMTTYLLVTRYTFDVSSSWFSFIIFFSWYACSILFFSTAIHYIIALTHWQPIICKAGTLPFSFAANFIFSYLFLGRRKSG